MEEEQNKFWQVKCVSVCSVCAVRQRDSIQSAWLSRVFVCERTAVAVWIPEHVVSAAKQNVT